MPISRVNKVVINNEPVLDVSEDTVTEEDVVYGVSFHDAEGNQREGTITNYRDTVVDCIGGIDEKNSQVVMVIENEWGILDFLNAVVNLSTRFVCRIWDIVPQLGNAKPSDVKKGVIFSSNQGIKLVGTYEEEQPTPETKIFNETYVMAANETKTINCGFKPKFVWFGKNATGSPLVSCYYNESTSTTQYMQATANVMRWLALGSGAPSIDITDTGFIIKNGNNANANMRVVAIG